MTSFVDTHCHIDRYGEPMAVLAAAVEAGVSTVAVTELPSSFKRLALRLGRRDGIELALGIHPLRAHQASPMELSLFSSQLDRATWVGEVGLDGSRQGKPTLRVQRRVFAHLLSLPRLSDKTLTVHSRGAEAEVVEMLRAARVRAVLHWYSGAAKHVETALAAGLYFSVNPAMLRSRSGQRLIGQVPPERVLCETDGPWTKVGSRASEPRDVPAVVSELGSAWGMSSDEAAAAIQSNFRNLRAR